MFGKKLKPITLLLLLGFVVVPLLVTPWALDPFEIDKVILARIIGVAAFVLFATKKGLSWMKVLDYRDPGFWYILLVVWSIIATIFSINPFRSVFGSMLRGGGLLTVLCAFGLYLGLRSYGKLSDKTKLKLTLAIAYTTGVMLLLSIAQYFLHSHLYVDVLLITTGKPFQLLRIPGTFGHPLYFGIYLVTTLPFAHYALQKSKNKINITLVPIIILASFIGIYFTRARIAMIAAAFLVAVYIFSKLKKYRTLIITNSVIILAAVLLLSSSAQQTIIRSESLFVRWQEWKFATPVNLQSPFFGYGFETYDMISINRERDPRELNNGLSDRLHNVWLENSWNIGFPGLIIFLILMITSLCILYKKRKDPWAAAVGLSLFMYIIVMQTSFDFSFTYILFPFLLSQAVILEAKPIGSRKNLDSIGRTSLQNDALMRSHAKMRYGLVVFTTALLITPSITNAMMFRAKDYLATGQFEKEINLYQKAQKINPTWPELLIAEAEAWHGLTVLQPENEEHHHDQSKQLLKKAQSRGWPWYVKASFE